MERIDSMGLFNRHGFERLFNRLRDVIVEKPICGFDGATRR